MIRRAWAVASLILIFAGVGLVAGQSKSPTIKEVMKKGHDNKTGLRRQIQNEADKPSPDWTEVQKLTKEFVTLASALESNKPARGDSTGWKKQCQSYTDLVKAIDAAASRKDSAGIKAANQRLGSSCGTCHKAHRE